MKCKDGVLSWALRDAPGKDAMEVRDLLRPERPPIDTLIARAQEFAQEQAEHYRSMVIRLGIDPLEDGYQERLEAIQAAYQYGCARGRVAGLTMAKGDA